jgi:hypothetical protein
MTTQTGQLRGQSSHSQGSQIRSERRLGARLSSGPRVVGSLVRAERTIGPTACLCSRPPSNEHPGRQRWREDAIQELLATGDTGVLFPAGCEENQVKFHPGSIASSC